MKLRYKRIFFIVAIPLLLGGLLHYTLSYKIKNILELIVEKQSNNTYSFHAKKIEISLWNKNLLVEDAQLISSDSGIAKTHYTIEIPQMTMKIESWTKMIFNQTLSINHVSFTDSKIHIHEKSVNKIKTNIDLQHAFKSFENMLVFLEVNSFSVTNGSFSYKTIHSEKVLAGKGINFSIRNLSQKNKEGHLLYSEDIILDLKDQEWNLPDGIHTVSFKKLKFSGKNEFFELDSFTVKSNATKDKGEVSLYADKFFFNSLEFESMYQKNTLNIDTLLCIRPILTLTADKNKPKTLDTSKSISKIFPQLFKELHFNYINIEDGQILLKKETKDQTSALVQKSNLKIFNLSINAMHTPFLKTDSILFGLKDIEFITPDSAFQIVASELMIINDDLVLKNSFFGPTHFNKTSKNISFSAPEFRLNNINFIDLIQKRLNATQAELFQPTINVHASKSDNKKPDTSETTIKHFYAALHDFRELVGIEKLRIIDGNLSVKNADKQHTTIQMKGINALILPIHFVNSDSLIHIKHSLPKINIAAVSVVSDKLNISVSDFRFDGVNRKNYAAHIHLKMQDEVDIQGNNIYWETFDWDLFQKYKYIDIKEFDAQNLSVKIFSEEIKKNSTGSHIDLPNIHVGKLNIDQLSFQSSIANDTIFLNAHHVMIDSLHTIKRFFAWKKLDGLYKNIHIQKENLTANIQLLKFNALTEVVIQHVSINTKERDANLNIKIPAITILGNFYSTDFSRINVQKLNIQNLVIKHSSISSTSKKEASHKAFNIPINIFSKELIVSNAQINYEQIHASDTLLVSGQFNIKMQNMVSSKTDDKIFMFDTFILDVNQLKATKNQSSLEIPTLSMHSKNGSLKNTLNNTIQFDSDLSVHWHGSNFTHTIVKNNSILRLENLSGTFSKNNFIYTSDKAIELQSVLNNMNIDNGSFHFSNHHCVLGVNKIQWKNKLYTLSFSDISYQPKLSLEDANKHATSQFDYLTLTGKSVQLKNINIKGTNKDSAIYIQNILLDQIELTSTRDKNIPKRTAKLKEMPTKIIQSIGWPIAIDSVKVTNSRVIVHQIAEDTYTKATIPINNINATITNVTNRTGAKDSLYLTAHATILNVAINSFNYTESYNDSLSYFHASSNILPGSFTDLNPITVPLASLEIDNGYSNKLNAVWAGNKYAAIGQMNFIYKNLSIHILNKNDTSQTNLALRIESKLANEVIHKSNTKTSVIFFERNAEKQIFNYWLKVTMQGVYSSVGIRNSNKYLKQYARVEEKYRLPKSSGIKK